MTRSKLSFLNDYSTGAHPNILSAIADSNNQTMSGYGSDSICEEAKILIKEELKREDLDIHFVSGGTQANLITLASALRPHEAVIAARTAHICVHEAGAIEATGHRIIEVPSFDGKISPPDIKSALSQHSDEHMVKPRLVFISQTTEYGTSYSKNELESLSAVCRENNLLLYLDGARIFSAVCEVGATLNLSDIAGLVDAFYIGGTKSGALIGEAIILCSSLLKQDFRFLLKQHGALLAKGRLLGIQFRELFRGKLWQQLASNANEKAQLLQQELTSLGYSFLVSSCSNQIFPILPNTVIDRLSKQCDFYLWKKIDQHSSAIRLVTSWSTKTADCHEFIKLLGQRQ